MRCVRARRGLTLVEVLLALAISGIAMVPLAAMFQTASDGAVATRAALDLNSDARFALDRIAGRAATASMVSDATGLIVQPGVAPAPALTYTVVNGNLIETENATTTSMLVTLVTVLLPTPPRVSTIASNVSALALSAPPINGQPLLKIDLTLAASGAEVKASRTVRVGSAP
jgi:prepilin-type N-terminal cleavage/methylation domain-containing protein